MINFKGDKAMLKMMELRDKMKCVYKGRWNFQQPN